MLCCKSSDAKGARENMGSKGTAGSKIVMESKGVREEG